jgi:hypothetical protein|tara:strand:- start:385 stop:543 length:159 start_codon:yes stop_codon:yes gene_type:complete
MMNKVSAIIGKLERVSENSCVLRKYSGMQANAVMANEINNGFLNMFILLLVL